MQQVKNFLKEFGTIVALCLVIVVPLRFFIIAPFMISGASMDNTFRNANYLIIDKISYKFDAPKRGDVIVFEVPTKAFELQGKLPPNKNLFYYVTKIIGFSGDTYYIKRIIGLPGETVQIDGEEVKIYNASSTKGFLLNEPYANINTPANSSIPSTVKITLGDNEYFVMGDNRHNSSDSRVWGILPKGNIQGRALSRLLPLTEISIFPGEHNEYEIKN